MAEPTVKQQVKALEEKMLELTWQRVALGHTTKDQQRWEELMAEIQKLSDRKNSLLHPEIFVDTGFNF